jgi:hypothetical protein
LEVTTNPPPAPVRRGFPFTFTLELPITIKKALDMAKKVFGKTACVSWNPKALTESDKEPLRAEFQSLRGPNATPEQRKRRQYLSSVLLGCRASIGVIDPYFGAFMVKQQADTFEDAFEIYNTRKTTTEGAK